MRRIFILLLSLICLSASAQSMKEELDGQWSDTLSVGAKQICKKSVRI